MAQVILTHRCELALELVQLIKLCRVPELLRCVQDMGDLGAEMHFLLEHLVAASDFDDVLAQPHFLHCGTLGIFIFLKIQIHVVRFATSRGLVPVVAQRGYEACDYVSDHLV